jgi:hypothetical protein
MPESKTGGIPSPEKEANKPLAFIVVGSGQVVDKYWFPAMEAGLVNIAGIVTLEKSTDVGQRHANFTGDVVGVSDAQPGDISITVVNEIVRLLEKTPGSHIALAVPANVRLALTQALLESGIDKKTVLFLETLR